MAGKAKAGSEPEKSSKQIKISQGDLPAVSLEAALRVAQGLQEQFAGREAAPHDVALALDVSPTSSSWRVLSGAAVAYGLTIGAYNAQNMSLTELGKRVVAPIEEDDDIRAKAEASLKPRLLRDFFAKYDRGKFPRDDIAKNVLAQIGVPHERLDRALDVIKENGAFTGIVRNTRTGPFVALAQPGTGARLSQFTAPSDDGHEDEPPTSFHEDAPNGKTAPHEEKPQVSAASFTANQPKQIFVAHGKNHKPLDELKKVLDQFRIPYKVAVDEPNIGRPISKKVAQLMKECSAGIFIFTADEKFMNAEGVDTFRPSENVVYELGAASVLWENKIIILKQKDVNFPSDYKDLGYIEFEENGLASHALDLLKELVGLDFVRVQAA